MLWQHVHIRHNQRLVGFASLLSMMSLVVFISGPRPELATAKPASNAQQQGLTFSPPPLLLRKVSAPDAAAINASIPFSAAPRYPAEPFRFAGDASSRDRAVECLAMAIYYEASGETREGQAAVAQVVLNRVRHPAFPASICGVVFQGSTLPTGCQFSFTCDGALLRQPSRLEWERAVAAASAALSGFVYGPVGVSTHYHTDQVVPYWATSLAKSVQLGAHIFYRWPGAAGRPASFSQRYSSVEPHPLALRARALIAHGSWPSPVQLTLPTPLEITTILEGGTNGSLDRIAGSGADRPNAGLANDAPSSPPVVDNAVSGSAGIAPATQGPAARGLAAGTEPSSAIDPGRPPVAAFLAEYTRASPKAYRKVVKHAEQLATEAASDWQIYTGTSVQRRKVQLLVRGDVGGDPCNAIGNASDKALVRWPVRGPSAADLFISAGFAGESLRRLGRGRAAAGGAERLTARLSNDIALAVFARIAGLSKGESAARSMVEADVARGHSFVPLFERRLRYFEKRRDRFATLNDFLPLLLAGLTERDVEEADRRAASRCKSEPVPAI